MSSPASTFPLSPSSSFPWRPLLPAIALCAGLWLLIFNQERLEWTVNVVYSYGWAVPLLAGYLLWERWRVRPVAGRPVRLEIILAAAGLLLLAYLPIRVIQEANPDWVKINWAMASLGVGVTLLAISSVGGFSYGRYFACPVLFCLTALPWPVWLETDLVQDLTRGNAAICAEILTWAGIPALAVGNMIQVANHWVNVEAACSGIRSLQTAFMMSLFLGELHRLSLLRRAGLVAASFVTAFVINLLRTLLLTYLEARSGSAERWHDQVGVGSMVLCLVAIWLLAGVFNRPRSPSKPSAPRPTGMESRTSPFPRWFVASGAVWLVGAELLTAQWYRWHEAQVPAGVAWSVAWPEHAPRFQRGEFAERTLALLKFNEGATASWQTDEGDLWQMYALQWRPGRVSKFLSSSHYPTVCLPAAGLTFVSDGGSWDCTVNGVRLPFATYLFSQGGQEVYVFHAIVEDRPLRPDASSFYRQVDSSERIRSVWQGERNLGQHVIGIALIGPASEEDARAVVRRTLEPIVRPLDRPIGQGNLAWGGR